MKTRLLIIIGIGLFIGAIGIINLNQYIHENKSGLQRLPYVNTPEHLKSVFFDCECESKINAYPELDELCTQTLAKWYNSTHYIDNNTCKFFEIRDGFVIPDITDHCPNPMITIDGKCMLP